MTAPTSLGDRFAAAGLDVCDRCLALSQLTVVLAKVPVLTKAAADLAPTPGALIRGIEGDIGRDRVLKVAAEHRGWSADGVRETALDAGLVAFCLCSTGYPDALRALADPPPVLYVRGDPGVLANCPDQAISMVGTRHPTRIGRDAASRIAAGLARSGATVVSGMALGIDGACHDGALSVGGLTVAVLASGADRPSPPSHRLLYDRILDCGAVVSEMPPGIQPFRWSFPARNRIIAALGLGTVVVEAPLRSGALITVEQAQDLGKDVFAVPGSLSSNVSEGTNRMLVDGAGAVLDGAFLASQLGMTRVAGLAGPKEGPLADVHEVLARGPLSRHELSDSMATSLEAGELELALLDLELAGWVARRPDGRYRVVDRWGS